MVNYPNCPDCPQAMAVNYSGCSRCVVAVGVNCPICYHYLAVAVVLEVALEEAPVVWGVGQREAFVPSGHGQLYAELTRNCRQQRDSLNSRSRLCTYRFPAWSSHLPT